MTDDGHEVFFNRELSWLGFARRVIDLAEDAAVPLLERARFIGIVGMLHDEFFMKRIGGLKRQIKRGVVKRSLDGRLPIEELEACRDEIVSQNRTLVELLEVEIKPALEAAGIAIRNHADLEPKERAGLRAYFTDSVLPILTPLAVDSEHPFPFISNLGLNLAIEIGKKTRRRFVRLKVPSNRLRFVPVAKGGGYVALEQVIAANLDLLFPQEKSLSTFLFRVTRGAEGERGPEQQELELSSSAPGRIVRQVSHELKARRFAGVVRLQVSADMPKRLRRWLTEQLEISDGDVFVGESLLSLADMLDFVADNGAELRYPPHVSVPHPRLRAVSEGEPQLVFDEIKRGDILLHHPYQSFDSSVLAFIEAAANDPGVLAIKLTIYRTSSDSPIVRALAEAARRGKQVAVMVEITARFDEAPNIAWGRLLENEGVHVAYGVEKLKTHVKLALVVREEAGGIRRYVHVGTGNYHSGTARVYEDLGILSCDPELSAEVTAVFNELTSATPYEGYNVLLVAPRTMRRRFVELIRRETANAAAGLASGIRAKMNQLQDPDLIRELYDASRAGVPISLNVRGLCCLRPGVPGMSDTIRVFSVLGRFLEHGRVYQFHNGGDPEVFIGSADWMKRNLDRRVETIVQIKDPELKVEIDEILDVLEKDNATSWELLSDGSYSRLGPADGEPCRATQITLMEVATKRAKSSRDGARD